MTHSIRIKGLKTGLSQRIITMATGAMAKMMMKRKDYLEHQVRIGNLKRWQNNQKRRKKHSKRDSKKLIRNGETCTRKRALCPRLSGKKSSNQVRNGRYLTRKMSIALK